MNKADEGVLNTQKIYSYIYRTPCSNRELYDALGLSMPTIIKNLKLLESCGLIAKDGFFESEGGRKASVIKCVPDARLAIGLEILKKSFHLSFIDLYGNCLLESTCQIRYASSSEYFSVISSKILEMAEAAGIASDKILGIGISMQGLVSQTGQEVIYGRLLNNTGLTLDQIRKDLPYPCVLIHDAKASALAEKWVQNIENATYIGLNMNIGSAILVNGEILTGNHLGSGSVEHVCMVPKGKTCYCGRKGCLEMYCSGEQLEEASGMKLEAFFPQLRSGDTDCVRIWTDFLDTLALAVNNVHSVIEAPVILGGLLTSYFVPEDYDRLRDYICRTIQSEAFPIIVGKAGKYSSATGAALYYIRQFLDHPVC